MYLPFPVKIKRPSIMWEPDPPSADKHTQQTVLPGRAKIHPPRPAR